MQSTLSLRSASWTAGGRIACWAVLLCIGADLAMAQKSGGTLRRHLRDQAPSASIHEESTSSTVSPFMPVFNNLVVFDQLTARTDDSTIKPDLARSWTWSDGGRTLTFKLSEGVKWHDGKPFTSADVKCTWDTLAGKKDMGWRKNPRKDLYENLKEVTLLGPHEVRFSLVRPQPSFLSFLANGFAPVYPCHVEGRVMRQHPIGTGPFKVAEIRQGEVIRLVKNPDYFKKGKPYLDGIEMRLMPNQSTRVLSFVAGSSDVILDLTLALESDIKSQSASAVCDLGQGLSLGQLLINPKVESLKDVRIRKAIALAIDRKAFNDVLNKGHAQIGGVFLPSPTGNWGLTSKELADAPGYGVDQEKNLREARELMQAAGYSQSQPLKVKMMVVNRPIMTQATILFVDQMRKIGVEAVMEPVEISVWTQRVSSRSNYEISYWGSSMSLDDPDVTLFEGYTCGALRNFTDFCDKKIESMIEEQSAMTDTVKRKKLVQEIDRQLQLTAARPILHGTVSGMCWAPHVKNLVRGGTSVYTHHRMEDVWLEK